MLKIKKNPLKKPASDVTFDAPATLQKQGIEMLIALNLTTKTVITGPEVGLNAKILVTKEKPHFFFNPVILDNKSLKNDEESRTLYLSYQNYLGTADKKITIKDESGEIQKAINHLYNGIERANKTKKV